MLWCNVMSRHINILSANNTVHPHWRLMHNSLTWRNPHTVSYVHYSFFWNYDEAEAHLYAQWGSNKKRPMSLGTQLDPNITQLTYLSFDRVFAQRSAVSELRTVVQTNAIQLQLQFQTSLFKWHVAGRSQLPHITSQGTLKNEILSV